jgi:hypothetical protein
MPRHARIAMAEVPAHIIQRGNKRGACFLADGRPRALPRAVEAACRRVRTRGPRLLSPDVSSPSRASDERGTRNFRTPVETIASNFVQFPVSYYGCIHCDLQLSSARPKSV